MPLFADLDRLRADLDALRPLAPEQEARVLQKFRLEWNYNSNAIEGNSLTLGETRSLLLHGVAASGKSIRDHDDIRNHNKVVAEVELLSTETRPVTEHLIREMHEILLGRELYYVEARTADGAPTRQLIQPGTYKRNPNQALTATGERIFFASPEETPAEMTALLAWYRGQEESSTMHPVALAAEFHHRFVRIHPFDDGNGRMSRLLMNLILLRHGYPMTVIQAADRNRYLAALAEADAGEPEPFLRFIIENVEASLRLIIRAARGESIEEPSDLDKKLALLNKQLDAPTITKNEHTWNLSFQSSFVENTVTLWLINLSGNVSKLDFLFARKMMYLQGFTTYYGLPIRSISTTNANISLVADFLNREAKMNLLLDSIQLIFQWNRLKNNPNFNIYLVTEFLFSSEMFSIKIKITDSKIEHSLAINENNTLIFSGDYKNSLEERAIDTINYQIANKVYDFITAKLPEADTPPA